MAKTILVVDDSDISRMIATRALKGAGYLVIEAKDGITALELLDGRNISLTVCDLNMPNLDGLEFVTALKGMPQYQFMPVIMLTVADQDEILQRGKSAGVQAWMVKPFSPSQLVNAVNRLCP